MDHILSVSPIQWVRVPGCSFSPVTVPVIGKVWLLKPVTLELVLGASEARYVLVARCINELSINVSYAVRAASAMILKYFNENTISLRLVLKVQERFRSAMEEPLSVLRHHAMAIPLAASC